MLEEEWERIKIGMLTLKILLSVNRSNLNLKCEN